MAWPKIRRKPNSATDHSCRQRLAERGEVWVGAPGREWQFCNLYQRQGRNGAESASSSNFMSLRARRARQMLVFAGWRWPRGLWACATDRFWVESAVGKGSAFHFQVAFRAERGGDARAC